MKKNEIIRVFMHKSKSINILILFVISTVIFSTTIIKNITLGTEKKIYDSFISFFPHIQVETISQTLADEIFHNLKNKHKNCIRMKRIIADIDNRIDEPIKSQYLYVTEDVNSSYFKSLMPNLCNNLHSSEIAEIERHDILQSLAIDTVKVDAFQTVYLPGIIVGETLAKKLKTDDLTTEFGTDIVKVKINNFEQEFVIKGFLKSGNPLLKNICIIDSLYNLDQGININGKVKYFIFLQHNSFRKAFDIEKYYNSFLKEDLESKISHKNISLLTDFKDLVELIKLSKRISHSLNLISAINLLLAIIALFALVSIIIQNRRKEISIMLSLGKTNRFIFSIFSGIVLKIFSFSIIVSTILIIATNYVWKLIFIDLPYFFTLDNLIQNIIICLFVTLFATIISYYSIAIRKKKLIINIYKGI